MFTLKNGQQGGLVEDAHPIEEGDVAGMEAVGLHPITLKLKGTTEMPIMDQILKMDPLACFLAFLVRYVTEWVTLP